MDRSDIERRLTNDPSQDMLAVIRACQRRLRPVLMTTITTATGLLPLILSQDVLFYGMASAMAFGLLIGTLLVSLGLTPVLYTLFVGIKPTSAVPPSEGASLSFPEPKAPSSVPVRLSPPAHVVANGKSSRRPRKKARAH